MSRPHEVTPLTHVQTHELGDVLSKAFYTEPNIVYMVPDEQLRQTVLPWFFRFVARLGLQCGVVYTTPATEGGAIWLRPQHAVTFRDTVRAGGITMPFRFGWSDFRRSLQTDTMLAHLRQQVAPSRHWYLMALGVAPSRQGHGLGTALLHPILSRADTENLPCYLETFTERLVQFYAKQGFVVVAKGWLPNGGPPLWAMVREPQLHNRSAIVDSATHGSDSV